MLPLLVIILLFDSRVTDFNILEDLLNFLPERFLSSNKTGYENQVHVAAARTLVRTFRIHSWISGLHTIYDHPNSVLVRSCVTSSAAKKLAIRTYETGWHKYMCRLPPE